MKRLGVLGGTFDPVHKGHLAVAEAVRRELALDGVLLLPAFLPPHKPSYAISPLADRAAMLALAVEGWPGLSVSLLEAERLGPSYSIDTLRTLSERQGDGVRLYFIIGMDAFAEIGLWKEYDRLLDYASLAVVGRPDLCRASCNQVVPRLFPGFAYLEETGCWRHPDQLGCIHPVAMEPVAVSSTEVREALRQGRSVADLLPEAVADYVVGHSLYR